MSVLSMFKMSQVFGSLCLVCQFNGTFSLFLVKLLRQRCKLLNWLGIGLSEKGLCNNVKVVKPLWHLLRALKNQKAGGGGIGGKKPGKDRERRGLSQYGHEWSRGKDISIV